MVFEIASKLEVNGAATEPTIKKYDYATTWRYCHGCQAQDTAQMDETRQSQEAQELGQDPSGVLGIKLMVGGGGKFGDSLVIAD